MRFTYFWPAWAIVLGILIAIGVTTFVYLRIARPLQPRHTFLLIALRICAVAILLGCLLAPVTIEKRDITPPTHLAVLVDTSQSMQLMDTGNVSRLHQVNELLFGDSDDADKSTLLHALSDKFEVHVYPFGTELHPMVSLEEQAQRFKTADALTDIGNAIKQADAAWKGQQRAGIVLITDGAHNAGALPMEALAALQMPVYAIGVGAVEPPKDIQIQRIDTTPVAYTGHEHLIRATIAQTGYTGQTTRLALREVESQRLISSATLTFVEGSQQVEFRLTPTTVGNFQYTLTLPTLEGELTAENNEKTFALKVVKAKLNVFYLEGRPRWEYTFLKRALERDPDIELTSALLSKKPNAESVLNRSGGYYPVVSGESGAWRGTGPRPTMGEAAAGVQRGTGPRPTVGEAASGAWRGTGPRPTMGEIEARQGTGPRLTMGEAAAGATGTVIRRFPETREELSKYDVLIFGELTAEHLTAVQQRLIIEFVETEGHAVVFFPSRNALGRHGLGTTELARLLPVSIPVTGCEMSEAEFNVQLTQIGTFHPMLQLSSANLALNRNTALWRNLPALSRLFRGFQLRGGASVLLESGEGEPVMIFQRVGLGKSLLFAAEGLWNWGFGVSNFKDARYLTLYPQFWAQALRWMGTTHSDENRLYLTTDTSTYATGDAVRVTAQVYSETYRPQADATVQIEVTPPVGEPFQLRMRTVYGDSNEREGQALALREDDGGENGREGQAAEENRYTAQFEVWEKGTYRLRATSGTGSTDRTEIYVQPQLAELEAPQLNETLLKRLASRTGGAYFAIADAGQVPENIAIIQDPVFVDTERDMWAHPLVLILVVGLLGTEWFLRKRNGLT